MKKLRMLFALLPLMLLAAPAYAAGSLIPVGYASCGSIKAKIDNLYPDAKTACQPFIDNGKISLLLTSPLPILGPPETQRAWFVASVAVVGFEAQQAGAQNFSMLYMVDSETAKTLDAYAMPIARAVDIQQQVKSQSISNDTYIAKVMREMQPSKIPGRLLGKN